MERKLARSAFVLVLMTACAMVLAAAAASPAGDWPGWRGPAGTGVTDEKDLPLTWSWNGKPADKGENILWKVPLKGLTGHSGPIVWGDKVFLTTASKQTNEQEKEKLIPEHQMSCYQAADGKCLWTTIIPPGREPAGYAIYAVPTPVTDGKAIYAWFGSAVVVAVDFDGKILWRQERAGPFNLNPGLCSSLTLFEDTVLLLVDQGRDKGYLQALDKKTGEVKWERKREKTGCNNSTPILIQVGGKPQLVVAGERVLQGLSPATGEPIWWCKGSAFGSSPVLANGLIYIDKGNETGMVVDPTGTGDVTATHVKWKLDKVPGEYTSPVAVGDLVYRAHKPGNITCRKLATGEQVYDEAAKDISILASPFATADGRVYFAGGDKTYVVKAGEKFEILATNDLRGGNNGSSPAVSNGRIFIRGNEWLFCIGTK